MRQNSSKRRQHSSNYHVGLLSDRLEKSGFNSPYALAKHLGLNPETTYQVFRGKGTYKHVRPIADFFKINWAMLHELSLRPDQFDCAVMNGDSGRSINKGR